MGTKEEKLTNTFVTLPIHITWADDQKRPSALGGSWQGVWEKTLSHMGSCQQKMHSSIIGGIYEHGFIHKQGLGRHNQIKMKLCGWF